MTIFKSTGPDLAPPPDDLTLPQFILDTEHPLRQLRAGPNLNQKPWLIDDVSGKSTYWVSPLDVLWGRSGTELRGCYSVQLRGGALADIWIGQCNGETLECR